MTRAEEIQIKAQSAVLKKELTKAVDIYIQSVINQYNKENGTVFEKVHNCVAYKDIPTYPHQEFCNKVLLWNATVWESARSIELDVGKGLRPIPIVQELISELPKYE